MKFARYLEETQTPEWKKAYINYRALKKRITAVRRAEEGRAPLESPALSMGSRADLSSLPPLSPSPRALHDTSLGISEVPQESPVGSSQDSTQVEEGRKSIRSGDEQPSLPSTRSYRVVPTVPSRPRDFPRRMSASSRKSRPSSQRRNTFSMHGASHYHRTPQPFTAPATYSELLPLLSSDELIFFKLLDSELEKVELFYQDREKEMQDRSALLKEQLNELNDHRKLFYAVHSRNGPAWVPFGIKPDIRLRLRAPKARAALPPLQESVEKTVSKSEKSDEGGSVLDPNRERYYKSDTPEDEEGRLPPSPPGTPVEHSANQVPRRRIMLDPDEYQHAKKRLKKAILEHYRALEMLHNYRILNVTGFRKALKKFEKVTRIPCIDLYMREKVETSAFASDIRVRQMMSEMENFYATRFVHGDKKRAMARLRSGTSQKSHHFSSFRSGIYLGLALPPLISGIYFSFQPEVRAGLPGWGALLYIYAVLVVPVLLAMLIGVNLLVWSSTRINYVFIFELDMRTRLDHREYFETPSFLLTTLCWAFWLTFSRIGNPTVWPLVWLALVVAVLFDPLPVNAKSSRFWLLRNLMRQFMSGTRRVEFADFWMGDQFCSLVFTLSNLYIIPCVYATGIDDGWRRCTANSKNWPVMFVVGTLPLLIRVVQSVKRYYDSRLVTHLVNGGKYGTGILMYLMYFFWRHGSAMWTGPFYALYIVTAILYSFYACTWDFLMDWSILKTRAKYFLLRDEVLYTNHIPLYYLAIIYNALIRFAWVMYIPDRGPDFLLRTFIVGMLEMTRRWVWNFYRLENEHLGNMDQYRVTREVPLPYSLDELDIDMEEEADEEAAKTSDTP